jgi:hypothetical protein
MTVDETRYLVDKDGNRLGVVLGINDYEKLLDEAEELESIRAFDKAKACGEEPVPFERGVSEIEQRRK